MCTIVCQILLNGLWGNKCYSSGDVNSPQMLSPLNPVKGRNGMFSLLLAIAREGCRVLMLRTLRPVLPAIQTACPVYPKMHDGPSP